MITPGAARRLIEAGDYPTGSMTSPEFRKLMVRHNVSTLELAGVLQLAPKTIRGWKYRGSVSPLMVPIVRSYFATRSKPGEFRLPEYFDAIRVRGIWSKDLARKRKEAAAAGGATASQGVQAAKEAVAKYPAACDVSDQEYVGSTVDPKIRAILLEASSKVSDLAVEAGNSGANDHQSLIAQRRCVVVSRLLQDAAQSSEVFESLLLTPT